MDSNASGNNNRDRDNKGRRDDNKKGGRYNNNDDKNLDLTRNKSSKTGERRDQQQKAPRETIEEDNLEKFLKKYFANYYAQPVEASEEEEAEPEEGEEAKDVAVKKEKAKAAAKAKTPDFRQIRDLLDSKNLEGGAPLVLSDIIFHLLRAILEEDKENIVKFIPEFMADVMNPSNKRFYSPEHIIKGVDKFMVMLSDVTPDAPHMPNTFFTVMFKPLLEKEMLLTKTMDWCEKDASEIFATEGHFKLFLYLLQWQQVKTGSAAKAMEWFKNETSLMNALGRLKESNTANSMEVDPEELCSDVAGIEPDNAFVAFLTV